MTKCLTSRTRGLDFAPVDLAISGEISKKCSLTSSMSNFSRFESQEIFCWIFVHVLNRNNNDFQQFTKSAGNSQFLAHLQKTKLGLTYRQMCICISSITHLGFWNSMAHATYEWKGLKLKGYIIRSSGV